MLYLYPVVYVLEPVVKVPIDLSGTKMYVIYTPYKKLLYYYYTLLLLLLYLDIFTIHDYQ